MSKAKKIAFFNSKGGVGKTTSVIQAVGVLATQGKKILVIDMDKQRNATQTLLMNAEMPLLTVYDVLFGKSIEQSVGKCLFQNRGNANPKYYGVDCMAGNMLMENEAELSNADFASFSERLDRFCEQNNYDYVVVDMPPSNKAVNQLCFGYLVKNVVIPFSCDMYSVSGYGDLLDVIQNNRANNLDLKIIGVFLSRYNKNSGVDRYIYETLFSDCKEFIDIQIPLATDLRESVIFGRPISFYKKASKSKSAFEELTKYIDNHCFVERA